MLAEANDRAAKYEWVAAAKIYDQVLEGFGVYDANYGRIAELLARSCFKAAFQSENREQFKERMQLAESSFQRAQESYERRNDEPLQKLSLSGKLFATFWLLERAGERREVLERCITLSEDATRILESRHDNRMLAEAHGDLLKYLSEILILSPNSKIRNVGIAKAVEVGRKLVNIYPDLPQNEELLESFRVLVGLFGEDALQALDSQAYEELASTRKELVKHSVELAKRLGTSFAVAEMSECQASLAGSETRTLDQMMFAEQGLSNARQTRDSYLMARLLAYEGWGAGMQSGLLEDPAEASTFMEKAISCARSATKYLTIPMHGPLLDWVIQLDAEMNNDWAMHIETERSKKIGRLQDAIEIAKRGLSYKESVTYSMSEHALSKSLLFLASLTENVEQKRRLLKEALSLRAEQLLSQDVLSPRSWGSGVARNYVAMVLAELARTESDPGSKDKLFQEALSKMQECVEICGKWAANIGLLRVLAYYEEWYGDILVDHYELTNDKETMEKAVVAYHDAATHLAKSAQTGIIGTLDWKVAKLYDKAGSYKLSSGAFEKAAENYQLVSIKNPGLTKTFNELSAYMSAWSLIELGRLHHVDNDYAVAADNYTRAAEILRSTRDWDFLAKHYEACCLMEMAEAMSRQENQIAAIDTFGAALKNLGEAHEKLQSKVLGMSSPVEENEIKPLLPIIQTHIHYCKARVLVEEAKILDRNGEEAASGDKYQSAHEAFEKLQTSAAHDLAKAEFGTLAMFCKAWAKMKHAETQLSGELYAEAAETFRIASSAFDKGKTRVLALANASICEALRLGMVFQSTHEAGLYSEVKKQLEVAASQYEKIGLNSPAHWTRATQRLFDALICFVDAESERDARKKAEFYHLSEKNLELSARLYEEAGYHQKKREALKQMRRAREQKDLLFTPVEVLAESPSFSQVPVTTFSTIDHQAVGLQRFETATVVGNATVESHEVAAGSRFDLELEMVNCGKTVARLLKLENLVVEGLNVDTTKGIPGFENGLIDLKGRRLDRSKNLKLTVPLKGVRKGSYQLSPRLSYVDDVGQSHSYDFDPQIITVRELGISGWLKGPR